MSAWRARWVAWRGRAGVGLRDVARTVGRSDLAIAYVTIVLTVYVILLVLPDENMQRIVTETSTNLDNLRERPIAVLVESAFVISSPGELWLVLFLLVTLAYLQRHVGRLGAAVVAASCHVGATLVVAVVLSTGIFHGFVDPAVRSAQDVGVSYVLAGCAAFLVLVVPRPWTWWYLAGVWAFFVVPGAVTRTFTDVGHATSLGIGTALALLAWRVLRSERLGLLPRRTALGRVLPDHDGSTRES